MPRLLLMFVLNDDEAPVACFQSHPKEPMSDIHFKKMAQRAFCCSSGKAGLVGSLEYPCNAGINPSPPAVALFSLLACFAHARLGFFPTFESPRGP